MRISMDDIREELINLGYYVEDDVVCYIYNQLMMFDINNKNVTQDIYALCLEGPPGAGKTTYAKVFCKLASKYLNEEIKFIEYQCDETTGKNELYEDINISAAVKGDYENVNIPGILVEAINEVNKGSKVVLFIDEFDKAREQTDTFLLDFLQSGKLRVTQVGSLEVNEEYKSHLQVILCKNDFRKDLTGPLSRRTRFLRLDYMKPELAYKLLKNIYLNKVDRRIIGIVSLMYEAAYKSRHIFKKLPSFSELVIAVSDGYRLLFEAKALEGVVYNILISSLFKSVDDINAFKELIANDSTLNKLLYEVKEEETSLKDIINQDMLSGNEEDIDLGVATLNFDEEISDCSTNFFDSPYIKRRDNIFMSINREWSFVGNLNVYGLSHEYVAENLIKFAKDYDVVVYSNGFLLVDDNDFKLIVVNKNNNGESNYVFMSSHPIIPEKYVNDIFNFCRYIADIAKLYNYEEDSILSLEVMMNTNKTSNMTGDMVMDNVYLVNFNSLVSNLPDNVYEYCDINELNKLTRKLMNSEGVNNEEC